MDDRTKQKLNELDKLPEEYFIKDMKVINDDNIVVLVKPRQPYFYDNLKGEYKK
jgi:hypothetical protein